jgi:DNA-binding HxlR family transcriptional regulator
MFSVRKIVADPLKKRLISKLRKRQPRRVSTLGKELKLRPLQLEKLLDELQREGLIVVEKYSGERKIWLAEGYQVDYLGRDPSQKKPLKRKKERGSGRKMEETYMYV